VATPFEPAAFDIAATEWALDDHVVVAVRSCVVPSENVPVAVKPNESPAGSVGLIGVTLIATKTALVTVKIVEADIEPNCAEIWVMPGDIPVATPFEPATFDIAATKLALDDHVTNAVRSCVVESENTPVAVKAWVRPAGTEGLVGVILSESKTTGVTVNVVEPEIEPNCAEICVEPADTPVATPFEPAAFDIGATAASADDHVTDVVRSRVVPSENVPVAVKAWVCPAGTDGLVGVISIESKTASVTVNVVEPDIEPNCAEICVEPTTMPVATPFEPASFDIAATEGAVDDHVTDAVRSCVVESENTPVAVKAWVRPAGTDGLVGVTPIDVSNAPNIWKDSEPIPPLLLKAVDGPLFSSQRRFGARFGSASAEPFVRVSQNVPAPIEPLILNVDCQTPQ
jgi:hypothetical protein